MHLTRRSLALSAAASLLLLAPSAFLTPSAQAAPPTPDPQMKAVLDTLKSLSGKPIDKLRPALARVQPGPGDAVKALLTEQDKSTAPEPVGMVQSRMVPGPAGKVPVRIYTPEGDGPFPVVVYYHGGGWVIASIDAYDSSCRALCNAAKAVVISVGYRQAPEHRFPAAHEDSYAALQYIMKNAGEYNGDPAKVAVAGESAGGNLATAVCLMAHDRGGLMPVYSVCVYPITDTNTNTPSYKTNAKAVPLSKPAMEWFFKYTISSPADLSNKYLAVLQNPDVKYLPPTTVITDEIDPLMSEGKAYADKLKAAGVEVRYKNYDGVTHEFFSMTAILDKAKDAVAFAADGLKSAFNK